MGVFRNMLKNKHYILISSVASSLATALFFCRNDIVEWYNVTDGVDIATAFGTIMGGLGAFALIPFTVYWYKNTRDGERVENEKNQLKSILIALGDNSTVTLGSLVSSTENIFFENTVRMKKIAVESGQLSSIQASDISNVKFKNIGKMQEVITHVRNQLWLYETIRAYNEIFDKMILSTGVRREAISRDLLHMLSELIDGAVELAIEYKSLMTDISNELWDRDERVLVNIKAFDKQCIKVAKVSEKIKSNMDRFIGSDDETPEILNASDGLIISYNRNELEHIPLAMIANKGFVSLFMSQHRQYGKDFLEKVRKRMLEIYYEQTSSIVANLIQKMNFPEAQKSHIEGNVDGPANTVSTKQDSPENAE